MTLFPRRLNPKIMSLPLLIKMGIFFLVGLLTWSLALVRTIALVKHRTSLVCLLVFLDEFLSLLVVLFVIQENSIPIMGSCAAGGCLASYLVMHFEGKKNDKKEKVA
jgi:hypothetical protein